MVVSIDERREVAARLRKYIDFDFGDSNPYWYLMKAVYGDVAIHDDNELFDCLADLIEPEPERTCCKELMVWFLPATEFTPYREVEYFGCSWCGEYLSDTDCYGLDDGPNYCSNCGRMVDKSFVIDESTGEVIYRDGVKVVEQ